MSKEKAAAAAAMAEKDKEKKISFKRTVYKTAGEATQDGRKRKIVKTEFRVGDFYKKSTEKERVGNEINKKTVSSFTNPITGTQRGVVKSKKTEYGDYNIPYGKVEKDISVSGENKEVLKRKIRKGAVMDRPEVIRKSRTIER